MKRNSLSTVSPFCSPAAYCLKALRENWKTRLRNQNLTCESWILNLCLYLHLCLYIFTSLACILEVIFSNTTYSAISRYILLQNTGAIWRLGERANLRIQNLNTKPCRQFWIPYLQLGIGSFFCGANLYKLIFPVNIKCNWILTLVSMANPM